jgi:Uncharacterized protein involved in tolerance to divalent cations
VSKPEEYVVVLITAGTRKEAMVLSQLLVSEKLAACSAMTPVQSLFTWKGKKERAAETLLIVKTKRRLFGRLERIVRQHHSYEVPEIIALPIIAGSAPYLRWIKESTV